MKKILALSILLSLCGRCHAQFFKKLKQQAKEEVDYRVHRKAGQKINEGLDTVLSLPKKVIDKKKKSDAESANANDRTETNATGSNGGKSGGKDAKAAAPGDEEDMSSKDGYVTLALSTENIFAGGILTISGESVNYKNFNQVEVAVSGPSGKDLKLVPVTREGKYAASWQASDKTGSYTVTVKGSDKKSMQSAKFNVYALPQLSTWADGNINITNKAMDQLEKEVELVKGSIGSKDKAELDQKMEGVKEKVNALLKLFRDLNVAGKQVSALAGSGKNLSPNLSGNLSALNDKLAEERKKMEQLEEYCNHEPSDNTVCEYLVLVNEACAAFSVYTNIEGFALKGLIKNIMIDKVVPQATSMVNQKANGLSQPNDFLLKEPAKLFSTAALDAESLTTQLGTASFAGDIIQFATDVLMNKYCGVFKGSLTHNYTIEFRNSNGVNWWTYGVEARAVLILRYPKDRAGGNVIKMKGNIEGNGTKFSFFEDIEKEDGFQEGSKGKIEVVPIKAYTPYSVSVATSEKDVLGFGAIARGLATPAYFNIPVDAEYDVNTNKIRLFLNPPIIDFSSAVSNQLVFLLIGGDLLPYIKRMSFPIHKMFRTLGSVVRDHNEFDVVKDKKGSLSFSGKANKHLGSRADKIEHDLNFSVTAQKQ